jgi:hypothetical protein
MEFYIEDAEKSVWHRVMASEIIMCEEIGRLVYVHRKGKNTISTPISIDGFHIKYLKGQERFVRTSSEHIVNKDMIIYMQERRSILYLKMEENKEALIRRGHEFAYFIKTNQKKPDRHDELYKEHQEYIDKVINTYTDCNNVKKMVQEKTGLVLTTKYIRDRYKVIKNS